MARWVDELAALCALPSVSATGAGMEACAALVSEMLERRGLTTEMLPTAGQPVVYGDGGRGEKTLLFYNHYDVQPPEPLELWDSPPFEATQRDGKLYARGVSDDKGHLMCRLAALDAVQAVLGELALPGEVPGGGRGRDRQPIAGRVHRRAARAVCDGRVHLGVRRGGRVRYAHADGRDARHLLCRVARADGDGGRAFGAGRLDLSERGMAAGMGAEQPQGAGWPRAPARILRQGAAPDGARSGAIERPARPRARLPGALRPGGIPERA